VGEGGGVTRPQYAPDGERFPGSERERGKFGSLPTLASEMVGNLNVGGEPIPFFPFISWSVANGFKYPAEAVVMLQGCGSAAEAYFLRELANRGAEFNGRTALYLGHAVRIQEPCKRYRLDVTLTSPSLRLAVEIDGMGFHHRSAEQIAGDYLRERRIVAMGYTVIRFTAQEAFGNPAECWRQIDVIIDSRKAA
jgi:very-short-patch-repair endonuclease